MKGILFFLSVFFIVTQAHAQHNVRIRNLWARAQVHVIFGGYKVSFTIHDINKALGMLRESGDSTYNAVCGLDTSGDYIYELFPDMHTEYHNKMQPLLQKGVGVYLLTAGRAVVEDHKRRALKEIVADVQTIEGGSKTTFASFYDPDTHQMLFSGQIYTGLIARDFGIDVD